MVISGQKWLCSGKSECIRQKWLSSGKDVVFEQKGEHLGKVVEFGQSGCIRESGCFWAKLVVYGQTWLYSGKNCCTQEKRLYTGKNDCGPLSTVTSQEVTWNEGPDQALQGKRLSSRNYAAYAT